MANLGDLQNRWKPGYQNTMTARAQAEQKHCGCEPEEECSFCNPRLAVRAFSSGATRDSDEGKNDYEGFLSPLVLEAYGDYMTEHRRQSDGTLRDSDNWQKGIPKSQYMKSLLRHVLTAWKLHRGWAVRPEKIGGVLRVPTMRETLCAILFNAMGYMHEMLKEDIGKTEAAA